MINYLYYHPFISAWRTSFSISCKTGLVVTNTFRFFFFFSFKLLLFKHTILEQMSLKISQMKDFFFIQQIRSRGEFLHSSCYEPDFFFPFFFLFFILFFVFAMGVATVGQKHLHAYIQCILQRYNKSVCDRISQKPHLFPLSHVQFWLKHISLQHLNIQRETECC